MNRQNDHQQTQRFRPPEADRIFIPTPQLPTVQMPFVTDSLVVAVFERGQLPQHLNSFENLKTRLNEAFRGNLALIPFFQALAEGLEKGQPLINQPVQVMRQNPDKMTVLHWVCQHEFLNLMYGCHLSDDIVSLLLKAGADPNALRIENQTNPMFFAVKYGSLQTVNVLLEAGVNTYQRDHFGNSCLKNALEHPKPMVIRRLLEYIPATERFKVSNFPGGEVFLASTTDVMLAFAVADPLPKSWVNLGVPATNDILETFMMLRQNGARLTQRGSYFSIQNISTSVSFPNHPQIKHPKLLQKLAEVLVGTCIPESIKLKKEESNETPSSSFQKNGEPQIRCPICLENVRKSVTLYCDHTLCRECILDHGKSGADCPMCRVPLCRDVSANGGGLAFNNIMGLDCETTERYGPKFFTDGQVEVESKAQGIYNNFLSNASRRDYLDTSIKDGRLYSREMKPIATGNVSGRGRVIMELASNVNLVSGTPPSSISISPKDGMVNIEVSINDIPLLARISNQSLYTVVSRSMVEKLGLKRIDKLTSRKFVDYEVRKIRNGSTFTCLEPVKLCFQGIEVTLRNAIEVSPDPPQFETTVQLGKDFLCSGLLSVIDVKVDSSTPGSSDAEGNYQRVVSDDSWPIFSSVSKESFRYYSHHGRVADLPLIHFDPFQGEERRIMTVSLRENVKFKQCNWCCRGFPDGMLMCSGCEEAYYCDERCQVAAWKIHKLTCGIVSEE